MEKTHLFQYSKLEKSCMTPIRPCNTINRQNFQFHFPELAFRMEVICNFAINLPLGSDLNLNVHGRFWGKFWKVNSLC